MKFNSCKHNKPVSKLQKGLIWENHARRKTKIVTVKMSESGFLHRLLAEWEATSEINEAQASQRGRTPSFLNSGSRCKQCPTLYTNREQSSREYNRFIINSEHFLLIAHMNKALERKVGLIVCNLDQLWEHLPEWKCWLLARRERNGKTKETFLRAAIRQGCLVIQ